MPFISEKVEMRFDLGVLVEYSLVDLNPKAGGGGGEKSPSQLPAHPGQLVNPCICEVIKMCPVVKFGVQAAM